MTAMAADDLAALKAVVERLAVAWNAEDGIAFAELFTEDAAFVDIKANRDDGRQAIADRHVWLFGSVFAHTRIAYDLIDAAAIAPRLALGHVQARVASDAGPLETLATCLFHLQPEGWQLLMFHNTEVSRY